MAKADPQSTTRSNRSNEPGIIERLEPRRLFSTFVVTNTDDSGAGSLRDALARADANPGADRVEFSPALTSSGPAEIIVKSELAIGSDVTLAGPGPDLLSVAGGYSIHILHVMSGATVTLSGLTVSFGGGFGSTSGSLLNDGDATLTGVAVSGPSIGGIFNTGHLNLDGSTVSGNTQTGITNTGFMTVTRSTITNNINDSTRGAGGIANFGTMQISDSIIAGNAMVGQESPGNGGGIYNGQTGTLTVTRSTIWGNTARFFGGGILNDGGNATLTNCTVANNMATAGGGIATGGSMTLVNVTVSGNRAPSGNPGAGILSGVGTLALNNSIVAGNVADSQSGTSPGDIGGMVDREHSASNLIGTGGAGGLVNGENGNIVGVADPKLGPLADNGGPTLTLALLPGSAAIDAGSNALALGPDGQPLQADQRGRQRIVGRSVDIGAYEFGAPPTHADGDANGDGKVDFADLLILVQQYGRTCLNTEFLAADFNHDCAAGFDDLLILAQHYGDGTGTPNHLFAHRARR